MPTAQNKSAHPKRKVLKKKIVHPEISYHVKPRELSYEQWQIALRRQFSARQKFKLKNSGDHPIFSDFMITNTESGSTYKVAIRSNKPGLNFCSCPDFTINQLGICKHIEYTLRQLRKKRGAKKIFDAGYLRSYSSVSLRYQKTRDIVLRIGTYQTNAFKRLARKFFDENYVLLPEQYNAFDQFLKQAKKIDPEFKCYNDALDYILEIRDRHRREQLISERYPAGIQDPQLNNLLNAKLYDYQKEGILFTAKAGRCLLADDMGLGKTIQALGAAEIMIREFGIQSVMIICPTSLKYQWKNEIEKFTKRSVQVIDGWVSKRKKQYQGEETFKILSYNNVAFDMDTIKSIEPDLIILDEAQRIKNWKTQTAKKVKQLKSPYAIVLTGTPLENRLEELFSIVEFVNRYKLGPMYRFLADHQLVDEFGKIIGYKDLNKITQALSDILIRRVRKEVLSQLPERLDKHFFLPITDEQAKIHQEHYNDVAQIVNKWRKKKFLTEKEQKQLLMGLSCMRMAANSTYILDEETRFDVKIDELKLLLSDIFENKEEKVVIFCGWERMTRLITYELKAMGIEFENLHGGIPSKNRKDLITNFHQKPNCRVFISTDAGSTGLNLQCASILINIECPWNPAVLEQRIARIHRLGQHKPVQIFHFISKGTIEEHILNMLKFKKNVFAGVLDQGEDQVFIGDSKMKELMKTIDVMSTEMSQPLIQEQMDLPSKLSVESPKEATISPQPTAPSAPAADSIQTLIQSGIQFLQSIQSTSEKNKIPFIEKDPETNQPCIKIPIQQETIAQVASIANTFLAMIQKG